jgi:hypothetical protein
MAKPIPVKEIAPGCGCGCAGIRMAGILGIRNARRVLLNDPAHDEDAPSERSQSFNTADEASEKSD